MAHTTRSARITGPVSYLAVGGTSEVIPLGPCLVQQIDDRFVDIVWGESGDKAVALTLEDLEAAEGCGSLVVLD